ncbi:hypothetical protein [Croceicoccus marinus]|uniref:Uncharacterized protein n=1 Tax=Croceicoccus marinus TaxID=450378 RepID=A0A1Z1FAA2_9SPHN|nr:hypothetical protein [Croceicoccus marinus]ARU15665.1 hypothetical protein A9D14_05080 [Croceicoccus marinus]
MSKWLTTVVTTLSILALTSLVGALLKGPIDKLANANRLSAHVELAPWIDRSVIQELSEKPVEPPKTSEEILADLELSMKEISLKSGAEFGVARVSIENASSRNVTDANFRVDRRYGEVEAFLIDADREALSLGEVDRVKLPDLAPGDRLTVYMWGNFSQYFFPESFRSYSSEGEFRTTFSWPEAQEFEYQSGIGRLLNEYAWTVFFLMVFILAVIFGLLAAVQDEYLKKMLKDDAFYMAEKRRYLSDPKKFAPQFNDKSPSSALPSVPSDETDLSDVSSG